MNAASTATGPAKSCTWAGVNQAPGVASLTGVLLSYCVSRAAVLVTRELMMLDLSKDLVDSYDYSLSAIHIPGGQLHSPAMTSCRCATICRKPRLLSDRAP